MATVFKTDYKNNNITAKVNKLGITSYAERKYEPQTQNTFSFEFLFDEAQVAYIATFANMQMSSATGATAISVNNYTRGLAQINDILNSSIQQITSPTKQIGEVMIDYFNSQIKYAGKPTYTNANITMNTLIGLGSKNVLAGWANLCLDDSSLTGGWARTEPRYTPPPKGNTDSYTYMKQLFSHTGYKCDGILLECARDGTIVNQWKYIGMWVQSFTPGSYNMAGSNTPSQVSATIVVDKIEQVDIVTADENAYREA